MLKIEKEYKELYGDIPKDYDGRIDYLLSSLNFGKVKDDYTTSINRIHNIKWTTISYTIYLVPKGTPRPRSGRNGVFYVKGAKDNKKLFNQMLDTQKDITLITTAVKINCSSFLPTPKNMNWVEKLLAEMGLIRPLTTPDFDNLIKTYSDMMKDSLLYDDSLIIEGTSKKYYSVKPRIEIELSYASDYDSRFNEKKILKKGKG